MSNYLEEQQGELEALQSIYEGELTVIQTSPPSEFTIHVASQHDGPSIESSEPYTVQCTLSFTYTPTYPDEIPDMDITENSNLDEEQLMELKTLMLSQAQDNVGMPMVFAVVSGVQEQLGEMVESAVNKVIRDRELAKQREAEEEFKRFQGTIVTIESFLAWKTKFDAEMEEIARLAGKEKVDDQKLTGKQMFLMDSTMDDSDIQFLQDDGDVVEVDESLFQDMDDLDIDTLDDSPDEDTNSISSRT